MKFKIFFLKLIFSILTITLVTLYSCKDNPVTNPITTINVNGKTIDGSGNAVANVTVSIAGSLKVSGPDGSFSISGVTSPYDIKVVSGITAILYKGLTIASPQIYTIGGVTLNSCFNR